MDQSSGWSATTGQAEIAGKTGIFPGRAGVPAKIEAPPSELATVFGFSGLAADRGHTHIARGGLSHAPIRQ